MALAGLTAGSGGFMDSSSDSSESDSSEEETSSGEDTFSSVLSSSRLIADWATLAPVRSLMAPSLVLFEPFLASFAAMN